MINKNCGNYITLHAISIISAAHVACNQVPDIYEHHTTTYKIRNKKIKDNNIRILDLIEDGGVTSAWVTVPPSILLLSSYATYKTTRTHVYALNSSYSSTEKWTF